LRWRAEAHRCIRPSLRRRGALPTYPVGSRLRADPTPGRALCAGPDLRQGACAWSR
jgi:hypothetical protein